MVNPVETFIHFSFKTFRYVFFFSFSLELILLVLSPSAVAIKTAAGTGVQGSVSDYPLYRY